MSNSTAPKLTAYCWASGRIGFGKRTPKGALPIISGASHTVRFILNGIARPGHRKGVLLVPGIPEASLTGADPVEKLIEFQAWAARRLKALTSPN